MEEQIFNAEATGQKLFEESLKTLVSKQQFINVKYKDTYLDEKGSLPEVMALLPSSATAMRAFYGFTEESGIAESVRAVSETGLVFGMPNEHGDKSIVAVSQCALDKSFPERSETRGATPKRHPSMYNIGIHENEGKGIAYLLDNVLMAYHSGGYGVLPQDELFTALTDGIVALDRNYRFAGGYIDDELTIAYIELPSLREDIEAMGLEGFTPGVVFQTSDVSSSGANLTGFLVRDSDGLRARMGSTLSVRHTKSKSVFDFSDNVGKVATLLRDSAERLEHLKGQRIHYPEQCFANLCQSKEFHFPAAEWKDALDDFRIMREEEVTAFDLYWFLWRIPDMMRKNGKKEAYIISTQEDISRVMFAKWEHYDVDYATV